MYDPHNGQVSDNAYMLSKDNANTPRKYYTKHEQEECQKYKSRLMRSKNMIGKYKYSI